MKFGRGGVMANSECTVTDILRFFARKRDQYAKAGLSAEAGDCDLMIARVQRIVLDFRIDP